jgi:hypothetical protein
LKKANLRYLKLYTIPICEQATTLPGNEQETEHLKGLKSSFKKYFSKPGEENNWIANLFQ